MLRLLPALLVLVAACRTSLEEVPDADIVDGRVCKVAATTACKDAETQSSYAWVEANVFSVSCGFSGCHNGAATAAGRIDFKTPGAGHGDLVGIDSTVAPGRKLVVAGEPKQSYLLMIMQQFPPSEMLPMPATNPPADVGFMPQGTDNVPLCCQKLDAVERWIMAGAMP